MTVSIGTSGFVYDHWRGRFYPEDLPQRAWFAHYAARFDAVEINNTFYRLPDEGVVRKWGKQAPPGFRYAFKASRYITHMKRLLPGGTYAQPVENFVDRVAHVGAEHLGPILFQLPPQMERDDARLRQFLQRLPQRDGVRFAFEFRHASWEAPDVYDLLGEHGVAHCVHDIDAKRPTPRDATAKLVYARFHGVTRPYAGHYGPARLEPWARRIEAWRRGGHDVVAFFNNDEKAFATKDARWLAERLGVERAGAPEERTHAPP